MSSTREKRQALEATAEEAAAFADSGAQAAISAADAIMRSMDGIAEAMGLAGDVEKAQAAVHQSSRNLDAVAQCATAMAAGLRDLSSGWDAFARSGIQHSVEGAQRLMACRTLAEVNAAQTETLRQSVEDLVAYGVAMSEASLKIARASFDRCRPTL